MEPSLKKRLFQRLQGINQKDLPTFHVVMLPDFFVDHILSFDSIQKSFNEIEIIASRGGGNIPGIPQDIHQGGNAANTALGLARFGISAHLICQTSPFGKHVLDYFLGDHGVDLSGVKSNGAVAITAAMEYQEPQANIMIGDPGSVATFSFEQLSDYDIKLITSAHLVGVTNWNLNRYGTELASRVFAIAKKQNVRTFFDSGDPSPRLRDVPKLVETVLMNPSLDIFGLNENELNYYSSTINKTKEEMIAAVESLKKKMSARIDLHTSLFSCSSQTQSIIIPTIPHLPVKRLTGAGDAWNAANIFADLLGFADDERLLFANIAAGQYISSPSLVHSTVDSIINFIKKTI